MNKFLRLIFAIVFITLFSGKLTAAPPNLKGKPFLTNKIPAYLIDKQIAQMSAPVAQKLAKKFGITKIQGKSIQPSKKVKLTKGKTRFLPITGADVGVGTDIYASENEPSIAAKPNNPNVIVSVFHRRIDEFGGKVTIGMSRSLDRGQSWTAPVDLPAVRLTDSNSDPVIRWAPDSSRVYATYMSIREDSSSADIIVVYSDNNGASWSKPVIAIRGGDYDGDGILDFPDKPWLDVHPFPTTKQAKNAVYVTTTLFSSFGSKAILQSRSLDKGKTFLKSPNVLTSIERRSSEVIQGSRPIGGKNGEVLVCWYYSGGDGWLNGGFDIRCTRSINYGATFGLGVIAVNNISSELPYYLGPFGQYHRWWGGMFPALTVLPDGSAHITFAADPDLDPFNSEDGDIYYARSPRPWVTWSRPAKLSDDGSGKAQGYPTITTKSDGRGSILFTAWEDHRNSFMDNENYDIYADMTAPSFGADIRISDTSSLSDSLFIGDYIDASASRVKHDRTVHVIWTDRSDKYFPYEYEDDVYTDTVGLRR